MKVAVIVLFVLATTCFCNHVSDDSPSSQDLEDSSGYDDSPDDVLQLSAESQVDVLPSLSAEKEAKEEDTIGYYEDLDDEVTDVSTECKDSNVIDEKGTPVEPSIGVALVLMLLVNFVLVRLLQEIFKFKQTMQSQTSNEEQMGGEVPEASTSSSHKEQIGEKVPEALKTSKNPVTSVVTSSESNPTASRTSSESTVISEASTKPASPPKKSSTPEPTKSDVPSNTPFNPEPNPYPPILSETARWTKPIHNRVPRDLVRKPIANPGTIQSEAATLNTYRTGKTTYSKTVNADLNEPIIAIDPRSGALFTLFKMVIHIRAMFDISSLVPVELEKREMPYVFKKYYLIILHQAGFDISVMLEAHHILDISGPPAVMTGNAGGVDYWTFTDTEDEEEESDDDNEEDSWEDDECEDCEEWEDFEKARNWRQELSDIEEEEED